MCYIYIDKVVYIVVGLVYGLNEFVYFCGWICNVVGFKNVCCVVDEFFDCFVFFGCCG